MTNEEHERHERQIAERNAPLPWKLNTTEAAALDRPQGGEEILGDLVQRDVAEAARRLGRPLVATFGGRNLFAVDAAGTILDVSPPPAVENFWAQLDGESRAANKASAGCTPEKCTEQCPRVCVHALDRELVSSERAGREALGPLGFKVCP